MDDVLKMQPRLLAAAMGLAEARLSGFPPHLLLLLAAQLHAEWAQLGHAITDQLLPLVRSAADGTAAGDAVWMRMITEANLAVGDQRTALAKVLGHVHGAEFLQP